MKWKLLALAAGLLCVLGLTLYAFWMSLPLVLSGLVGLIPARAEDEFGRAITTAIARETGSCRDEATRAFLDTISRRLGSAMPASPYQFEIQVVRSPEVNAMAAPGGHIVLFSGLIEQMNTPEQVAAVLAHEMQHIVQRHSMRGIVRTIGLQALLTLLVGDPGILGDLAGNLTVLHLMRSDEQSADDEALLTLIRAGIPPSAMTQAFENLARASSHRTTPFKYLSTHPPLEERIEAVRRHPLPPGFQPRPMSIPMPGPCPATP